MYPSIKLARIKKSVRFFARTLTTATKKTINLCLELIHFGMSSRHILIDFLIAVVSVLANNLTALLIVASFMEAYMLIASTEAIVTASLTKFFSSNLSYRSEAWTIEKRE